MSEALWSLERKCSETVVGIGSTAQIAVSVSFGDVRTSNVIRSLRVFQLCIKKLEGSAGLCCVS